MSTSPTADLADLLRAVRKAADDPDRADELVDDLAAILDLPRTPEQQRAGIADDVGTLYRLNRYARDSRPCPNLWSRTLLHLQSAFGIRQEVAR